VLSRSLYTTLLIVKQYLDETGKDYITYNSIKAFASRNKLYKRYNITDRTLERALRELARIGYFDRVYIKNNKVVLYKPTSKYYSFIEQYSKLVNQ